MTGHDMEATRNCVKQFFLVQWGLPPTVSCVYSSDRRPTHHLGLVLFIETARLDVRPVLSLTWFIWELPFLGSLSHYDSGLELAKEKFA